MVEGDLPNVAAVDDFGNAVYRCRYTEKMVWADEAVIVGATIPGVKARYIMAPTEEAKAARKDASIAFHDSDANCNTCAHLGRVKHAKCPAGFLRGTCNSATGKPHESPYASRQEGEVMLFHPDDWMGMTCHESRWTAKEPACQT